MSVPQINHSSDLKKLRDDGFKIEIIDNYLLVHRIPYLDSSCEIREGILVSELTLSGGVSKMPSTHVINFIGDYPCEKDGSQISAIRHQSRDKKLSDKITVNHSFSNKPKGGYSNYYDKVFRYVEIISAPAKSVNDSVTAKVSEKVIPKNEEDSIFNYGDTNSTRAEIKAISEKLENQRIAIIGLGGTGSYLLDQVAKTPVQEIHLFDGDSFLQHNAFRSPGAPPKEKLAEEPYKTDYFKSIYSQMHSGIKSHSTHLEDSNIGLLYSMDFVFVCIDKGGIKETIFDALEKNNIPFIDVGLSIQRVDEKLIGMVRVTSSTEKKRDHVRNKVSFSNGKDDEYNDNIQIAELNALNACLAVIKWKKIFGFYQDLEEENTSIYSLNVNQLESNDFNP